MYLHKYRRPMCICRYMCGHVWRPKVDFGCLPQLLFAFFIESGSLNWTQSLLWQVWLASLLWVSPDSTFQALEFLGAAIPTQQFSICPGHLNTLHAYMTSSFYLCISHHLPSLWLQLYLKITQVGACLDQVCWSCACLSSWEVKTARPNVQGHP